MKITSYTLLTSENCITGELRFIKLVQQYIEIGWQPFGPPFVLRPREADDYGHICQAMVMLREPTRSRADENSKA